MFEPLHAVTYFAPECRDAPAALGLRGFWRGYFAGRAAPMGAVPAGVVEATFFNFHPTMVRKAVPAVWDVAPPSQLVRARATGAAAALRRMVPGAEREVKPSRWCLRSTFFGVTLRSTEYREFSSKHV